MKQSAAYKHYFLRKLGIRKIEKGDSCYRYRPFFGLLSPPIHEGEKHIQFMMAVKLNARITASAQTVVISDIFKLLSIKTPSGSNVAYL